MKLMFCVDTSAMPLQQFPAPPILLGRDRGEKVDKRQSQSEHVLELSKDLLDDIELGRLESDKLLLKCARLARITGNVVVQEWIQLELRGYHSTGETARKYLNATGRWINIEKNQAYWGSLATQEAIIASGKARLEAMKLPNISGDYANLALNAVIAKQGEVQASVAHASRIRATVIGLLHSFVAETYYEREFSGLAEGIFERYKRDIDTLIAEKAGKVLEKIPAVVDRLAEKDPEGISQALTTCRRIIDAFADAIFPPSNDTFDMGGGNVLKLDASKHQNRINAYIAQRTNSTSRRQRLRQNLSNLYDRVSTGTHKDVSSEEAFSLFLNVYLLLGEILHLMGNANGPSA